MSLQWTVLEPFFLSSTTWHHSMFKMVTFLDCSRSNNCHLKHSENSSFADIFLKTIEHYLTILWKFLITFHMTLKFFITLPHFSHNHLKIPHFFVLFVKVSPHLLVIFFIEHFLTNPVSTITTDMRLGNWKKIWNLWKSLKSREILLKQHENKGI